MYWIRASFISSILALSCLVCRGQFLDAASGLLQAPSAEMGEAGTVMFTANFLNQHATPPAWGYDTFNYGISIVFLPRLEIGYVPTLLHQENHPYTNQNGKVEYYTLINQDQHFYVKVQLFREGEFGKSWVPALAVGVSDPSTRDPYKDPDIDILDFNVKSGNGFFNRYYIVATKHIPTRFGTLGAHLGYQYNVRHDRHYNAPCAAIDWKPVWLQKEQVISTRFIAEYDSLTFNIGFIASLWREHFEVMVDLQSLKWISAGVRYKLVLK